MNLARVKLSLGHEHPNGPGLDTGGKSATLSALCDAGASGASHASIASKDFSIFRSVIDLTDLVPEVCS